MLATSAIAWHTGFPTAINVGMVCAAAAFGIGSRHRGSSCLLKLSPLCDWVEAHQEVGIDAPLLCLYLVGHLKELQARPELSGWRSR